MLIGGTSQVESTLVRCEEWFEAKAEGLSRIQSCNGNGLTFLMDGR